MTKAQLTMNLEKIYKNSSIEDILRDLANCFSSSVLEEFYEHVKDERELTEKDIKYMD